MRADRLVTALLMLQAQGMVTAEELAGELGVSVRTARRDLEGLAMAGIPVCSQPGRGGGWTLIGGSRIDLSGLTAAEARTLFLVAGPAAATPQVKTAVRKLVRSLPSSLHPGSEGAEGAEGAVVLDPSGWDHDQLPAPVHLGALRQAVLEAAQVRLGYAGDDGAVSDRVVHPLDLVIKHRAWYLIGQTEAGPRSFAVGQVRSVERSGGAVQRPVGFDLAAAWRAIVTTLDTQRAPVAVHLRTDAETVDILRDMFGTRLVEGSSGTDGRVDVEARGRSEETVARQLAGLAGRIEVLSPVRVRRHLAEIGRALVQSYGTP